jgi:hypothetical protein
MIKPEAMPGMTKPTITPERMFASPVPISAAPVAKPVMQSTTAPIISGIMGASKAAMGFDWSKFNKIGD